MGMEAFAFQVGQVWQIWYKRFEDKSHLSSPFLILVFLPFPRFSYPPFPFPLGSGCQAQLGSLGSVQSFSSAVWPNKSILVYFESRKCRSQPFLVLFVVLVTKMSVWHLWTERGLSLDHIMWRGSYWYSGSSCHMYIWQRPGGKTCVRVSCARIPHSYVATMK